MGGAASDQRSAVLREAACQRGVDVLVRQVVGRGAAGGGPEPGTEAREHEPAQPHPGRHGRDPREGAGCSWSFVVRRGNGDVDCHELLIGRRRASLERVMPAAWLRAFRGPCGRHEELAVRALEPAVTLGLAGDQFSRERLLAVWAPDLVHRVLGGKVSHSSQGTCAQSVQGRKKRYVSSGARSGAGGRLRLVPRWMRPRNRSPSGRPTASRPAFVRRTCGVRQ